MNFLQLCELHPEWVFRFFNLPDDRCIVIEYRKGELIGRNAIMHFRIRDAGPDFVEWLLQDELQQVSDEIKRHESGE